MNVSRLTWQLPVLILLTTPLWQGAMQRFLTLEQGPITAPFHQDSSFLLEDLLFSQINQGEEKGVTLRAKRAHGNEQGSGFDLEGTDVRRLGPNPLHITSGQAFFDPDRQILTLLEAVVVETADLVVRTPAMRYLAKYETLKSATEVEMTGNGMTLTGTSFMYNLKNGNLRVGQRVRFHYTPSPANGSTE